MIRWLRKLFRVRLIDELCGPRALDGASLAGLTRAERFSAIGFICGRGR